MIPMIAIIWKAIPEYFKASLLRDLIFSFELNLDSCFFFDKFRGFIFV